MSYLAFLVLLPFSLIFGGISFLRNRLYGLGFLKSYSLGECKVISIGNLTAGGTGKTPFVEKIVCHLKAKGKRIAVLSRGYGSKGVGVREVELGKDDVSLYGDEPVLLKSKHPEIRFFVGTDKVKACKEICEKCHPEIIVADDAFQHRRLKRDLDILLLDASVPKWHYFYLPSGRLRDCFCESSRADALVLTKTNLAIEKQVKWLSEKLSKKGLRVFESSFQSQGLQEMVSRKAWSPEDGDRVVLISGIGNPKGFEKLVSNAIPVEILEHFSFSDHHAFSTSELETLQGKAKTLGASKILVTEKDAVKIRKHVESDMFVVVEAGLNLKEDEDEFFRSFGSIGL